MAKIDTLDKMRKALSIQESRMTDLAKIEEEMRKTEKGYKDKELNDVITLYMKIVTSVHQMQENQELEKFSSGVG